MKSVYIAVMAALGIAAVGQAHAADPAGLALAKAKNCLACHNEDKKVVGPAYKDVAAKYKGDANAQATLVAKVKAGGKGVWGPVPMPPNNISDEDANKLVAWVLSH